MTARRIVRLSHGWIGVILGLFIVLVAGSGACLAFVSEMFLVQFGEMLEAQAPTPGASYVEIDAMIAAAQIARGKAFTIQGIMMPHTRLSKVSTALVYGVEKGGDPAFPIEVSVDPWTGAAKGSFSLADAFGHDLLDFHHELLLGEIGVTFVSALGVLLMLFALSGLWLWWPRKGSTWRRALSPGLKGSGTNKLFQLHVWLGIWTALLVTLFALTGAATVRPNWFGPLLDDMHEREPRGGVWSKACEGATSFSDAAKQAVSRFPGKQVSTICVMPGEPIHVYLRGPGDVNTMQGDSLAWVHPSCDGVIETVDASLQSTPEWLGSTVFTLHGGYSFGPFVGPILVLVTGLSLVFFAVSGIIVFFTRTWRPSARAQPHQ